MIQDTAYSNTDEEYREICDFLDGVATQAPYMLWESGRMNFWRYNVHANRDAHDPFISDNVHIWRDTGIVGFSFACHFENIRTYDLKQVEFSYALEAGFTIQTFSESLDYAGRVALVRSAFGISRYTKTNLKQLMASPDYIDAYNLSVLSPEGQQVAYCIGWHERAKAHRGYIEPVATHADYRRRGFAKALSKECFRRMKANGVKTVEIASRAEPDVSNYLYDSLLPQSKREVHKYVKRLT